MICVARLPHESQPRPKRRPRAPQLLQEALCSTPAKRKQVAPCKRRPRTPQLLQEAATRRVPQPLHSAPPHETQPRPKRRPRAQQLLQAALCTALPTRKPAAAQAVATRPAAPGLCVLRLPHESQPRPKRRPRAQQLLQEALCSTPATRKPSEASRGPSGGHARSSSSKRLCLARLPHESHARRLCVARLPHEASRGPSGGHARRSSSKRL